MRITILRILTTDDTELKIFVHRVIRDKLQTYANKQYVL